MNKQCSRLQRRRSGITKTRERGHNPVMIPPFKKPKQNCQCRVKSFLFKMYLVLFLQLMTCLFKKREKTTKALLEMLVPFCDERPFERIIRVLARGPTRLEKKNVLAFVSKSPFAVHRPFFSAVCLIVLSAPNKIKGVANKAEIKTQRKSLT